MALSPPGSNRSVGAVSKRSGTAHYVGSEDGAELSRHTFGGRFPLPVTGYVLPFPR
jgi:hypothetical protein